MDGDHLFPGKQNSATVSKLTQQLTSGFNMFLQNKVGT